MSDEHRADVAGFAGNSIVRTPVLDELARSGVVFSNAYTPSPICVPARQCLMSGQLPKTCGCEGWVDLPPGHMTFARRFAEYGYDTQCFGKLHHQGTDQMQGWLQRPAGDVRVMPRYLDEQTEKAQAEQHREFMDYKWSDAKEIQRAGIGQSPLMVRDEICHFTCLKMMEEMFASPFYDREHVDQPKLIKLSLILPHYPYLCEEKKFVYHLNRVEPYLNQTLPDHPALARRAVRVGEDVNEREVRRATAAYYGMVETIDTQFGTLIGQLANVGQNLDDWIIVYTSDHGEMLGEHSIWEKQSFYEGSVRVPLIIRWPKGFEGGRVIEENVSLCDLFATLCDLVELPVPPGLDSRSLVPLLAGRKEEWLNEVVSQLQDDKLMIKWHGLKYLYFGEDHPEVLFDLGADPGETRNVIGEEKYAAAVTEFRKRRAELGHGPDARADYVNAGYGARVVD